MALVKSHSNYVLKKKHQTVSDGTIWERDITTIGGVNQFSPGQIPIYRSNNFIITVRNDGRVSNQFNKPKWYENSQGTIWTLENVNEMVSPFEEENDIKIVLKKDYYDFNDFAYYGSLSELFRSSIIDIGNRFPGELFLSKTNPNAYYEIKYVSGQKNLEIGEHYDDIAKEILGNSGLTFVFNPFGIDIHSVKIPKDAEELKYFANDGYKNYQIIIGDGDEGNEITGWTGITVDSEATFCPGDMLGTVSLSTSSDTISIEAWIGDNNNVYYLYNGEKENVHIRPNEEFISKFYNECDNFEKIILDRKTTPKYKAIFSVIKENDFGYYREMEEFVFPTAEGGYNLDISEFGLNTYTASLSEIGEFYDERFTDNLYRSMTHEAIKNFDWTFTREFYEGDADEYIPSGEKIQKTLRLFAREFDEIKSYIDNISNYNRVTYDERNNVPDYFLTDLVTDCGWDVKLVMPYDLKEVYKNDRNEVENSEYTLKNQLENSVEGKYFVRQFSQKSDKEIIPYTKKNLPEDIQDGYFVVVCDDGTVEQDVVSCGYVHSQYNIRNDSGATYNDGTFNESCTCSKENRLKYRMKSFTDERPYTYLEANNEFLRRLKINSPYIWRHKGTVEGLEMILGMFGMKSKRWVEAQPESVRNCKYTDESGNTKYDFEIVEYSSFTNRIEEEWDAIHQMYRIDWLNSTKTISYDYRTISKYNSDGNDKLNYISYQGIPVGYRDEYEIHQWNSTTSQFDYKTIVNEPYIKISPLGSQSATSDSSLAFKEISQNNSPVRRRYLYPQFEKEEQYDGNPYFQMNGGWLSKSIGNGENTYNFQFDLDDNVVFSKKINVGKADYNDGIITDGQTLHKESIVIDDKPLFKETVRNIRMVNNIKELLSLPKSELYNGIIVYVTNVEKDIATIGNTVYEIKYEYNPSDSNNPLKYIELIKSDGIIRATFGMYFSNNIIVYDKNKQEVEYNVSYIEDGTVLKGYIFEDLDKPFICKSEESIYEVNSFTIVTTQEDDTNYFVLDNVDFSDTLTTTEKETWNYGWRRLKNYDCDFLRINTIENYYKGNNPHNGKMIYDSGHEYFTYFNRLFKHAYDNSLFDERCFNDNYEDIYDEINKCGFNGLIDKNEIIKQYTPFLTSGDTKIRYFGNYKTRKNDNTVDKIYIYGENLDRVNNLKILYGNDYNNYSGSVTNYTLKDYKVQNIEDTNSTPNKIIDLQTDANFKLWTHYAIEEIIDESTYQIVNNKRISVIFNLHEDWYTKEGQTEVKYLDSIVMNYLTQLIPSTVIVDIYYRDNEKEGNREERTVEEWECLSQ